jgi:hypothetical protein
MSDRTGLLQLDPPAKLSFRAGGCPPSSRGVRPLAASPPTCARSSTSRFPSTIPRGLASVRLRPDIATSGPVPPAWFRTTLAVCSKRAVQVCCTLLPVEVRRVSREGIRRLLLAGSCSAFLATRFVPPEELPSSAAVPCHHGPCLPAFLARSSSSCSRACARSIGCVEGAVSVSANRAGFRSPACAWNLAAPDVAARLATPARPRTEARCGRTPANPVSGIPDVTTRRCSPVSRLPDRWGVLCVATRTVRMRRIAAPSWSGGENRRCVRPFRARARPTVACRLVGRRSRQANLWSGTRGANTPSATSEPLVQRCSWSCGKPLNLHISVTTPGLCCDPPDEPGDE